MLISDDLLQKSEFSLKYKCIIVALLASSPVTKSPEPEEPQDSKASLPIADSAAPQPDPDAWIQVEKRHRQTKVQMCAVVPSFSSRLLYLILPALLVSIPTCRLAVCR